MKRKSLVDIEKQRRMTDTDILQHTLELNKNERELIDEVFQGFSDNNKTIKVKQDVMIIWGVLMKAVRKMGFLESEIIKLKSSEGFEDLHERIKKVEDYITSII